MSEIDLTSSKRLSSHELAEFTPEATRTIEAALQEVAEMLTHEATSHSRRLGNDVVSVQSARAASSTVLTPTRVRRPLVFQVLTQLLLIGVAGFCLLGSQLDLDGSPTRLALGFLLIVAAGYQLGRLTTAAGRLG